MLAARKGGLKHYWGSFDGTGGRNLLFVGASLGVLGLENSAEVVVEGSQLAALMRDTTEKLAQAGFSERPCLYLQWQPDL